MTPYVRRTPELLAAVAQLCADVHGEQPHALAVAERFEVSRKTARNLIGDARNAGHCTAPDRSCRYPQPVLVCDDCSWSSPIDCGIPALQRHTLAVHGRNPLPVERMPRLVEVAA